MVAGLAVGVTRSVVGESAVRADLKAERAAARAVACRKGPAVRGTPDMPAPACAGKTEGGLR